MCIFNKRVIIEFVFSLSFFLKNCLFIAKSKIKKIFAGGQKKTAAGGEIFSDCIPPKPKQYFWRWKQNPWFCEKNIH